MPAYVIVETNVRDAEAYERYKAAASEAVAAAGGRYAVRGGELEVLEGDWTPTRLVVLEFPSMEEARRWYDSEEYRQPKAMRIKAGRTNLVFVEGVS